MSGKERDNEPGHIRDKRNGRWWWCHNAIIDKYGSTLGPHGIAVYAALCRYANEQGFCWPSVAKIAKDTGMSTNRVRQSLTDLQRVNLISIEHRKRKDDLNLPSIYTLLEVVEYFTTESTPPDEVLHDMNKGTSPDEVGVLHHVKGGTSPREAKEDSIKKTNLEKDLKKKSAANAAAADEPTDVDDKPDSEPPSKPKPPAKETTAKSKRVSTPRRKLADDDLPTWNHMKVLVCRACMKVDNDPVFWSAHGSIAGRFIKKWLAAGLTPERFEAEYIRPNGAWFRTWKAGTARKLPTPAELLETMGILDNFIRPTSANGHAPPPPTPEQEAEALKRAAEKARRAAVNTEPIHRPSKDWRKQMSKEELR
jgi:hypothetical protein